MKIELTKTMILIVLMLLIPTGVALAAHTVVSNGTAADDIILGTDQKDNLNGKGGDDVIFGLGNLGNPNKTEKLNGGNGDDEIVGDGDPLGLCTVHNNCIPSPGGDDLLDGDNGDDIIFGDGGDDDVLGGQGAGNDIMFAGAGNDFANGGNGADTIFGMNGDDVILGGNGNDVIFGLWGNDDITTGHGNDWVDCGEDANGQDQDIVRVTQGSDFWVNCETVLDQQTGDPINEPPEPPGPPAEGDSDGDGLLDVDEDSGALNPFDTIAPVGGDPTDKFNPDSDSDGLNDFNEVTGALNSFGPNDPTNPNVADTDGDGINDGTEISNGTDPNDANDPPAPPPPPPPTDFDVSDLITDVSLLTAVPFDPLLSSKDASQITKSLNNAQDAADAADLNTACNSMEQFDNRVQRLLDREKIDVAGGELLLSDSNVVQVEFCGATPLP